MRANPQLKLYNRILPGDFLHYGYFDDPETLPETVSFDGLYRAQLRYAEKLVELIERPDAPVLDAGSGMGGMLGLLRSSGYDVTGLTPDRFQVEHIHRVYPGVPVLRCRFEDICVEEYREWFGTVIHSESIQYMNPDRVFPVISEVLAPGGIWIVADYFREEEGGEGSGWRLDAFRGRLEDNGFRIVHESDITPNVLPTLGFAHLLVSRIGLPFFDFAHDKLREKNPGVHYVLESTAERLRRAILRNMALLDPVGFADRKRYLLMTMRRQ